LIEPRASTFEASPDVVRDKLFERAIDAPFQELSIERDGSISFAGVRLGKLTRGRDVPSPEVLVTVVTSGGMKLRLARRLLAWSRDLVTSLVGPFRDLENLQPNARGLVHLLTRGLGTVLASDARDQLAHLDASDAKRLTAAGVVIGGAVVYATGLTKPATISQRVALASAFEGAPRSWPRGDEVSITPLHGLAPELHAAVGYPLVGPRAIRADVLERFWKRLATIRDAGGEWQPASLASWLGSRARDATAVHGVLFPE